MTGFVVILTALHLTAPVHCYQTTAAWNQQADAVNLPRSSRAYYDPNTRTIGLNPYTCKLVRQPTLEGANILAHELAHVWQDDQDRALNDPEADRIALLTEQPLLRRLALFFGRKPAVVSADRPVLLHP